MNKKLVLLIGILVFFTLIFNSKSPTPAEWYNASWNYRVQIEINTSQYSRTNWPVEHVVNFTSLLQQVNDTNIFDNNSIRLLEYDSDGNIMYEINSQFDQDLDYSASGNARGVLSFIMNGSSNSNSIRTFFLYFDSNETGPKPTTNYQSSLIYSQTGDEFNVNNSRFEWYVDSARGDNTSGLYKARGTTEITLFSLGTGVRTAEYIELHNGSENLTFDLRNNITVLYNDSIRIKIKQEGYEFVIGNADMTTNLTKIEKIYTFYANSSWIKIEQNITNINNSDIKRNSTGTGALAFDAARAYGASYSDDFIFYNHTQPGSWSMAFAAFGSSVGVIHMNSTITEYSALNSSVLSRVGINLNSTTIPANESIYELAVMIFNSTDSIQNDMEPLKLRLLDPVIIIEYTPEEWALTVEPETDYTIYNRGEVVLVTSNANASYDVNDIVIYVNTTIDMGTLGTGDDQTLEMNDNAVDGDVNGSDETFSINFSLSSSDAIGVWNVTVREYDTDKLFLNESYIQFNVTDVYVMNQTIETSSVLVNVLVNASVILTNIRNTTYITGASVACNINGTDITNITDENNGSYTINFTSPLSPGTYTLNCTSNKTNNTGNDLDILEVETPTTNISLTTSPTSKTIMEISQNDSEHFNLTINSTNTGNASARSSNITLTLPTNWTADTDTYSCGNINVSEKCTNTFNITIANRTEPGEYNISIKLNWTNADSTAGSNTTNFTVNVTSNPVLNVTETLITNEIADGQEKIFGNFTVWSTGNDQLVNITFNITELPGFSFEFLPVNISSLTEGSSYSVQINMTIPTNQSPGVYNGTLNVTTDNDGSHNITVQVVLPDTTNTSITTSPTSQTVTEISQNDSEHFDLTINSTNTGNATVMASNVSISLPTNWTANTTINDCGRINVSDKCVSNFNITVANRTEDYLNSSVGDGTEETVGNFTVWSTGNEQLTNIEFNVTGLENFTFEFIPSSISSLTEGASYPVQVNVTVPLGHFSGIYTGTINISTDNADFITLDVNITVLENTTWMASPTECIKVEIPDVGSVCNVSINNTGNVEINFTVIPAADNESYAEYNNFSIPANGSFILEILYNVSGDAKITYNTLYNITPTQNATPENITINVTLAPFIQPDLLAYVTPNRSTENSTVVISVNVTDRTDLGINWTQATIIRPDNSIDVLYLNRTNTSGNQSYWSINYPYNSSIGNTTQRGIYNVSIMANDTTGASNISNTTFVIHIEMNPSLLTQSTEYFQGGTGTIYYKLVDLYSDGIVANVTVNITDPNGNVTFQETYQTDALGMINPQPQFTVSSDAILGDYVVRARAVYFDNFTNETLVSISNTSFEVLAASTGGGMFADLETAVNWFPNNIIQFSLQVYDSSGALLDPDAMNLTVYDPADNLYFNITMSDMTRESTGFYTYDYAMPTSTATGAYLAVLEVDKASLSTQKLKAFRVVSGGPFDLRITLLENEVYLGDYLDFQITMINMGELSQDVILEFWVTDSSNATWSYSSEAIYTSSLTNQTVTRSSFIFSGQSLGLHTLNARLTFDSVQPAVTSNVTFEIIQTTNVTLPEIPAEIITIGGGGTGPSSVETEIIPFDHTYNISIIAHPPQLSLVKGWIGLETITVKNTGDIELNNITLVLIGLPSPWVNIKTKQIDKLNPAETGVFEVEFNIPKGAEVRDYDLTWLVVADYAVAEENSVLTIFNSQADLLKAEIKKLKEELAKLKIETKFAEDIGKDVASIYTVLEEITSQIAQAEVNLDNELLDESTENIVTASRLIEEAKQLLAQAPFLTTFTIEAIPFMYIIIIVVILIGINAFLLVWIKGLNRDVGRLIRPNIKKVRELVGIKEKKDESDEIAKSKKKIMGIIDILEKEYEEGVISKPTYEELVKTHKKRLKELNKKNR